MRWGREARGETNAPISELSRRARRRAQRRWPLARIVSVTTAVLAATVFAYPATAQWISAGMHSAELSAYASEVQAKPAAERADALAAAQRYNEELPAGPLRDPYTLSTDGETTRDDAARERYHDTLAGTTGVMATLSIPSIGLALPVFHGTDDATLNKGIGHLFGTSLPVGGAGTHAVLTGHSGQPGSELFTRLSEVAVGDEFTVTVEGTVLTYRVDTTSTVLPNQTDALRVVPGQDHITLITCTPIGVNTHRLLVRATRVETTASGATGTVVPVVAETRHIPWAALAVPGAGMLAVLATHRRRSPRPRTEPPAPH